MVNLFLRFGLPRHDMRHVFSLPVEVAAHILAIIFGRKVTKSIKDFHIKELRGTEVN